MFKHAAGPQSLRSPTKVGTNFQICPHANISPQVSPTGSAITPRIPLRKIFGTQESRHGESDSTRPKQPRPANQPRRKRESRNVSAG